MPGIHGSCAACQQNNGVCVQVFPPFPLDWIYSVPGASEGAAAAAADSVHNRAQVNVREAIPAEQLLWVHPPDFILTHHLVRLF